MATRHDHKALYKKGQPRPPNSGRKKGTPNKRTTLLAAMQEAGEGKKYLSPMVFMSRVMRGDVVAIYGKQVMKPALINTNKLPEGTPDSVIDAIERQNEYVKEVWERTYIPLEAKVTCAKELAQYESPKLKAVEHSQNPDRPLTPSVIVCAEEAQIVALEKQYADENAADD